MLPRGETITYPPKRYPFFDCRWLWWCLLGRTAVHLPHMARWSRSGRGRVRSRGEALSGRAEDDASLLGCWPIKLARRGAIAAVSGGICVCPEFPRAAGPGCGVRPACRGSRRSWVVINVCVISQIRDGLRGLLNHPAALPAGCPGMPHFCTAIPTSRMQPTKPPESDVDPELLADLCAHSLSNGARPPRRGSSGQLETAAYSPRRSGAETNHP